jgi:hypothetical protein
MFKTENEANREIHLIADAGLGKTTFSNYLAITWCQAHFPEEEMTQFFEKDDIDCMLRFDFLFLVLLRDSYNLCSIDDLIFENIVSNLGLEERPTEDFLLKILKNEKCLVILDGLDEWTHPEKECHRLPRSFPHRNDRKKCTILTTTRPWKLSVMNLNSCQIGTKVELAKLSLDSAATLTKRILQSLKSHSNEDALQNDVTTFISEIKSRQHEHEELSCVPLLLMYIICLWCDGVEIGNSNCDLHMKIVELFLFRAIQKHGDLQQLCHPSDCDILECFAEYENCKKYRPLLMRLGKLAFYTLVDKTKENTLVFDKSVAQTYLSKDEMIFTFHLGMLSERTTTMLTKKLSKVSFFHKTFQEFFAAILISSENEAQKIVLECKNVQDILDMSMIYKFISTMNASLMCEISTGLMPVINNDFVTCYLRKDTKDKAIFNPLYEIQIMFLLCLEEMPKSANIQLCLQDFFIHKDNKNSKQFQRLFKQNKPNIKSLYINTAESSSNLREIIYSFSLTDLSQIQKLQHYGNREMNSEISRILFPSLQAVALFDVIWTDDDENLSENLARLQNLQYLHIFNFTFSHKIQETFFNFISGQKSMKDLTLEMFHCKEHIYRDACFKRLNLDLSKHSSLTRLHFKLLPGLQLNITTPSLVNVTLWSVILDESSLFLTPDMVNIKYIALSYIKMSARRLQNFITVLENLPQSVTVNLHAVKPEKECKLVRQKILSSQSFHLIRDDDDFIFKTRKQAHY